MAKRVEKLANFEAFMRILLLPLSGLYHIILKIRHVLFDGHILPSKRFDHPVICIGNLCLGGTGKTPHTEYLAELLSQHYRTCIVSRGYGRRSKGFVLAHAGSSYEEIGDEPLQYVRKFPTVQVAVDADRAEAVQRLLDSNTPPQVFLLDDAFQHRSITAGWNILLTEYGHLYVDDRLIPAGSLRDIRSAAHRADMIIVTKSPQPISDGEKKRIAAHLKLQPQQRLFFSHLHYGDLVPINEKAKTTEAGKANGMVAFCGIARPEHFTNHLKSICPHVAAYCFHDHHPYSENDIRKLLHAFDTTASHDKIMVTTEKDAMRLIKSPYFCLFNSVPLFTLPVEVGVDDNEMFHSEINLYVRKYFSHHAIH